MSGQDVTAIRTVIVDDHRMVREGLKAMLRDTAVDVVGEADNIGTALEAIGQSAPEVVLLDVRLQGQSGFEACRAIAEKYPGLAVVFLTVMRTSSTFLRLCGPVPKDTCSSGPTLMTSSGCYRTCGTG